MTAIQPTEEGARLGGVDLLRGVALTGILFMNVMGFALAPNAMEAFRGDPATLDFWVLAANGVLLEGKMRALFGMVFGAGVWLFVRNKGIAGWRLHALTGRRMGLLVLFGLAHAHLLLWLGDILYLYGICGILVYGLRNLPARWLLAAVPLVAVLDFMSGQAFHRSLRDKRLAWKEAVAVQAQGGAPGSAHLAAIAAWNKVQRDLLPDRARAAEITRTMQGTYAQVAGYIRPLARQDQTGLVFLSLADSVALMLLGLALFKLGFLSGAWDTRTYRRIAGLGYGLGLPLAAGAFAFRTVTTPDLASYLGYLERTPVDWIRLVYPIQRMLLVLGHASLLLLLVRSGRMAGLVRRFQAVGRMAFSNYIAQTVLATLTFFGYGLGLYGRVGFWQTQAFALGVAALALAWSPWWLARFRFGPLEWLWRSLTYLRIQSFRRGLREAADRA